MEAAARVHHAGEVLDSLQLDVHRVGTAAQIHFLQIVRGRANVERIAQILFPNVVCVVGGIFESLRSHRCTTYEHQPVDFFVSESPRTECCRTMISKQQLNRPKLFNGDDNILLGTLQSRNRNAERLLFGRRLIRESDERLPIKRKHDRLPTGRTTTAYNTHRCECIILRAEYYTHTDTTTNHTRYETLVLVLSRDDDVTQRSFHIPVWDLLYGYDLWVFRPRVY